MANEGVLPKTAYILFNPQNDLKRIFLRCKTEINCLCDFNQKNSQSHKNLKKTYFKRHMAILRNGAWTFWKKYYKY